MQQKEIKEKAKLFLSVNSYQPIIVFAMLITVFLAFFMFTVFLAFIKPWLMIFGIIFLLSLYVFSAPLKFSLTDYYMRSYNQNTAERFVIFDGYKKGNFGRSVLLRLINTGISIGLFVLIVPGIIYLVRSSFSFYLLNINPGLSPWQAVKQSMRLTKKSAMKYFKFSLGFLGWFLLVAVTFGIFSFYVTPYFHTAKSVFFRNVLLGKEDDDPNYLNEVNTQISKILNSEIENIEKELQMLQQQTYSRGVLPQNIQQQMQQPQAQNKQPQQAQQSQQAKQANPSRKMFENVPPPAEPKTGTNSGERLFMDDVGDIRGIVSGIDDVEEMVLPEIKSSAPQGYPAEDFNTRDVEIMENESFDDFKKRLNSLRSNRDNARNNPKFQINSEPNKFRTITSPSDKKLFEKEKLDLEVEEETPEAAPTAKPAPNVFSKPSSVSPIKSTPAQGQTPPVSANTQKPAASTVDVPPVAGGVTSTPGTTTRLSRAEILEKLKNERARRTQTTASAPEQDKKQE